MIFIDSSLVSTRRCIYVSITSYFTSNLFTFSSSCPTSLSIRLHCLWHSLQCHFRLLCFPSKSYSSLETSSQLAWHHLSLSSHCKLSALAATFLLQVGHLFAIFY